MTPYTTPPRHTPYGSAEYPAIDRLTLSPQGQRRATDPPQHHDPPHVPHKSGLRGTFSRTPEKPLPVAGPSYEAMSSRVAPSSYSSTGYGAAPERMHQAANEGKDVRESSHTPRRTSPSMHKVASPPTPGRVPPSSPPRSRNPIYPALASPPRDYSTASSSTSPNLRTPSKPQRPAVDTTSPGLRTHSSSRTITQSSPVSPSQSPRSMHIIASSRTSSQNRALTETPPRTDKQGRPMMSARRSGTSSSRTITRANTTVSPTSPPPVNSQDGQGQSEASAYARAMAAASTPSRVLSPASSIETERNKGERPLPRPPGPPTSFPSGRTVSNQVPPTPRAPVKLERQTSKSARTIERQPSPSKAQWPSPTPRRDLTTGYNTPPEATPLVQIQRPASTSRSTNGAVLQRPPGRPPLDYLLAHPAIQSSLLGAISINTFLSLSGSSEEVRRQFTGESVGRWVLREWTVQSSDLAGVRWPNLTVWEGFLESLLHDPATYSTYPSRWHNLLRHLSLSHTLVVLYLRSLPQSCYPNHALLPFEDDGPVTLPFSPSSASLSSMGQPRSRVGSTVGSETGSMAASRAPRRERVVEIVMPEPLAAQPLQEAASLDTAPTKPMRRRGSISSLASVATFSFGRRRSNSLATDLRPLNGTSMAEPAASLAPGKAGLPPVSYPSAKRYGFRNVSDVSGRKRNPSDSRPGSVFSFQTGASTTSYMPRASHISESRHSGLADWPLQAPPPIVGVRPRSSFGSVTSSRRSDLGSPVPGRKAVGPLRSEPAFDKPMPYIPRRAPVLRVFVPLSEKVQRWPSAEGALAAVEELEKCGALKRMRLGDLIINTAIRAPKTTEHVLLFVPFVKHILVPLQYTHMPTGHLPSYVDAFALPPSYYYPFLPAPQIIFLNLGPYRQQGLESMRLASDRRDMTVASGARISAKRYLYVAGVEVGPHNKAAPEWHGMVSLEAEGTAEGKSELERRFGVGDARNAPLAPWEIVKEKSMGGTVWLRLVKERVQL